MPTVFKKQYETVLMQQSEQVANNRMTMKIEEVTKEEEEPMGSHRVEYMTISKRIVSKK